MAHNKSTDGVFYSKERRFGTEKKLRGIHQGEIVKGITNFRGLSVISLIVALTVMVSVPVWGTSCSDTSGAGGKAGTGRAAESFGEASAGGTADSIEEVSPGGTAESIAKAATDGAAGAAEKLVGLHRAYILGYPDGSVRPTVPITREETAVIFYRLLYNEASRQRGENSVTYYEKEPAFTDVNQGHWSYGEIGELYRAGILYGYPDHQFRPDQPITRAEFAAMAARFEALSEKGDVSLKREVFFPDTTEHWAEKLIDTAVADGWIRPFGDGTFRAKGGLLRCETMMLINSALDRFVNSAGIVQGGREFKDNSPEQWYYEIVMEAANTHEYQRPDRPKSTESWVKTEHQKN